MKRNLLIQRLKGGYVTFINHLLFEITSQKYRNLYHRRFYMLRKTPTKDKHTYARLNSLGFYDRSGSNIQHLVFNFVTEM